MTRCSTRAICTTGGCTPRCSCPWWRTRCAAPGSESRKWTRSAAWSGRGPLRACASAWPRSWALPGTSPARPWTRLRRSPRRARTSRDSSARSWTRARGRSTPRSSRAARLTDDAPVKLEALLDDLRGRGKPCLFLGDGATANLARLAQEPFARVAPEPLRGLRASFAARLAAARPETYVSADALRPLYLRAPQAERARNARLGLAGEEESPGG